MADKAIGSLVQTSTIGLNDLLVLEQNNTAKSITGQNLVSQLATELDGHGGIASIAKTSSSGTNPKVDTYTITYADASTATFTVTNGLKGDTGAQTYVWIRYANRNPIADSDMTSTPDDWIGIYSGTSSSAPAHYTSYDWYEYKGDKGDTGDPAELDDAEVVYQTSASGTTVPTGAWSSTVPAVAQGDYLWTRTTLDFNSGSPVVSYSVGRMGVDGSGTGTVQSVNDVQPDADGDVALTAANIPTSTPSVDVQDVLDALSANGSVTLAKLAQEVKKAYTTYRASLTIPYASWTGSGPYSQTITIPDAVITSDTKVDIQPSAAVINQLISDGVTGMFFYNNSGTLTVYAVGASPTADLSVQVTYYETQEG